MTLRRPAPEGRRKVGARIDRIVATLLRAHPGSQWQTPAVTKIARRRRDPFKVLVSVVLSLRTKDEVTDAASVRLFRKASTPEALLSLSSREIQKLIYPVGFYRTKSRHLRKIARIVIDRHGGRVPCDMEALLALPGVGRKTANLVLVEGFRKPAVAVDTHVHRISNRLGIVATRTPEKTEMALREVLPKRHWIIYNELLVGFGQTTCRPISPFCSRCAVFRLCPRAGVTRTR